MIAEKTMLPAMDRYRVLVLGGYGFFGSRLARRLARLQVRASLPLVGEVARYAGTLRMEFS